MNRWKKTGLAYIYPANSEAAVIYSLHQNYNFLTPLATGLNQTSKKQFRCGTRT